ncbi:hypothetical protein CBS9595_004221 [Malassezia furfur]|nr:hypothetical protein CBS9595_004221 [Malassezia furfur]
MSAATPLRRGPRASLARVSTPQAGPRRFEIGDEVRFEGSDLVGVLRYLGPVTGRDGHFAGLELIGASAGRGKNDGTIAGHMPLPNGTPQRTPAPRPAPGTAPGMPRRPHGASATPQATRTTSMPRVLRRPTSAAATHVRPGSVLRTPQRVPSGFAFEDSVPTSADDVDRRLGLLEQMQLHAQTPTPRTEAPKSRDSASTAPESVGEAIALGVSSRSATPGSTKSAVEALHAEVAALKEALAARDAELAARDAELATLRKPADADHPADADAKMASMVAAWERERTELASRIEELQGAGREAISVLEHQLELAAREQQTLRSHVQQLETQLALKEQGDASVSATDIELTTLREQLAHLTTKHETAEEELAESRDALQRAHDEAQQRSATSDTAAQALEAQLHAAQAEAQQHKDALAAADAELARVREALHAEQAALEHERTTIETMRAAPHDTNTAELHAKIAALERAQREQAEAHAKEIAELESLVESRIFREDELETEMEQLRRERDEARQAQAPMP